MAVESPGSLVDFANRNGLDPASGSAWLAYTEATHQYREALAENRGVDLETLHDGVGSLAVAAEVRRLIETETYGAAV